MQAETRMEAERAVLGALILDPEKWDECAEWLRQEDFASNGHRLLYGVLEAYAEGARDWDTIVIADAVKTRELEEEIGGMAYLLGLTNELPSTAAAVSYAKIVHETGKLRRAREIGLEIGHAKDFAEVSEAAEGLAALAVDRGADRWRRIDALRSDFESRAHIESWTTGWPDLDLVTSLPRGEQVIVGARPSVGKSTLLLQLGHRLARQGVAVALFSLEEPARAIYGRALKQFDADPDCPLYVDSTGALTIDQFRAAVRRAVRKYGVGLVLVDYLQLLEGRGDTREQQVSSISRMGKRIALDENICVVMAAQLARRSEEHIRPRLSDLRESGAIEQDSDQVWLLHADSRAPMKALELEVAKNRNGPKDRIVLHHFAEKFRLEGMQETEVARYWQCLRDNRTITISELRRQA